MNWMNKLFSGAPEVDALALEDGAVIIDVRSPGEFSAGHVDGALNLPLSTFVQNYTKAAPDKSRQIILYCQSGARSGQAMQFLKQQGYERLVNGNSIGTVARHLNRSIVR